MQCDIAKERMNSGQTYIATTGAVVAFLLKMIEERAQERRVVPETIRETGGEPIRSRVGHSFIKQTMAETDAMFGGEHSGHYYFRDFWFADSGMLARVR